jgi:hypothetical protein
MTTIISFAVTFENSTFALIAYSRVRIAVLIMWRNSLIVDHLKPSEGGRQEACIPIE